jgi:hypothetical protein
VNFETWRDRVLGLLLPGVLTFFVISDFVEDRKVDSFLLIVWIAVCAGATGALLETWFGRSKRDE